MKLNITALIAKIKQDYKDALSVTHNNFIENIMKQTIASNIADNTNLPLLNELTLSNEQQKPKSVRGRKKGSKNKAKNIPLPEIKPTPQPIINTTTTTTPKQPRVFKVQQKHSQPKHSAKSANAK